MKQPTVRDKSNGGGPVADFDNEESLGAATRASRACTTSEGIGRVKKALFNLVQRSTRL